MADVQQLLQNILTAIYGKDVRQTIHDAIKQCYYDGKAGGNDLEARDRAAAAEARMDTFVKMAEGSTTGDAELADIRVGIDGKVYGSAGSAVREQIRNTHCIEVGPVEPTRDNTEVWINPEEESEFVVPEVLDDEISEGDTWSSKKINEQFGYIHGVFNKLDRSYPKNDIFPKKACVASGAFEDHQSINTYGFIAETDFYIWNEGSLGAETYLSIALYKSSELNSDNFISLHRYAGDTGENTLPTSDKKLYVKKGWYVAIGSVLGTYGLSNTYPLLGYAANEHMMLSPKQMTQIGNEMGVNYIFDDGRFVPMTEKFADFVMESGKNASAAGIDDNAGTDIHYFKALADFEVYGVFSEFPAYLAITIFDGTREVPVYKNRYRYVMGGEDTFPRADSPITIEKGTLFCVTVTAGKGFTLHTNYKRNGVYLSNGIRLNSTQLQRVANAITVDFKTVDGVDIITIYKLTGDEQHYIGFSFIRKPLSSINSNVWRMSCVDIYDLNFVKTAHEQVVLEGEWECAIKENGASDFMGGTAHGDEIASFSEGYLDGKPLDLSSNFTVVGKRFEFISVSELNRVDTPADILCNHVKKITITSDDIVIDQSFKFLKDLTLTTSYVTMLPINRAYTKKAWRLDQDAVEDISADGHPHVFTDGNKQKVFMSGDNLTATVDVDCDSEHVGNLYIANASSPRYNKVYFSFIGDGGTVKSGEIVKVRTTYVLNVTL